MKELEQLVIPLLVWYRENARVLPWRSDPTPYGVWISEIMLQQTRVAAVLDYYRRFLEAAPAVADLAAMPEDQLMKLWQGLGYYSRARNLQKAARQIMETHGGVFPILMRRSGPCPELGIIRQEPSHPLPFTCLYPRWTATYCGWQPAFVEIAATLPRPP